MPQLMTEIRPLSPNWLPFEILMNFGVVLIIFNMLISITIQQSPGRDMLKLLFKVEKESQFSHYLISIGLLVVSACTAMVLKDIISILSILGGFSSCFVVIFYPGFCYGLLLYKKNKLRAILLLTVTLLFTLAGFSSVMATTLDSFGLIHLPR